MRKLPGFLIVVIFLVLWNNIHYLCTSKNAKRHKDNSSTYAHYSKVDTQSYLKFPKLLFTHPQHFTLKEGEALFIPKGWWHWVKTSQATAAVNFWFDDYASTNNSPFVINHVQPLNWSLIDEEPVTVWKSDYTNKTRESTMGEFRNSNGTEEYTITLENYDVGNQNKNIKAIIKQFIAPPEAITDISYDFNVWVSNGKHDTGLHYDDENGYLCVIYGTKDITLYPPSDSIYLYPYPVTRFKWLDNKPLNFRYNSYQNFGEIVGKPSSHLLYETSKKYPRVLSEFSKFYDIFGENGLIWGFKKHDDTYRWELYDYNLTEDPAIMSWDINMTHPVKSLDLHFYHNLGRTVELPFWGRGTCIESGECKDEAKIFVLDKCDRFLENYEEYMKRMGYEKLSKDFYDIVFNKYSSYEICIHNKRDGQIFIQYLGITSDEFIDFLIEQKYPDELIEHILQNKNEYHIPNEITIVYDTNTKKAIRSGFYGIF
jgi:hypothetical protein